MNHKSRKSKSRNTDIRKKGGFLNTPALALERQQQQQQQSLFIPQKLYRVDINTRKKKNYKGKKHSHLEIAKLISLSGWVKRKKIANTLL